MKKVLLITSLLLACTIAMSQPEVVDQAKLEYDQTKVELKTTYQKIVTQIQKSSNSKILMRDLKKSQDSWLIYSQAEASFLAGITSEGGSAYTYDYICFLTDLTKERIAKLNSSLKMLPTFTP